MQALERLCGHPPVVTIAGAPVTASRIVPGIVLRQGFSSKHTALLPGTRVHFVALLCSLDAGKVQGAPSASVLVSSPQEYRDVMARRETALREGLGVLRQRGVQLLLCSERVSELAAFLCLDMGIALVHSLEASEVHQLCTAAGIRPASCSVVRALHEAEVGHSAGLTPILLGTRPSLLLQLSGQRKPAFAAMMQAFTLLVYGPSEGLARQYSRLVGRSLALAWQLTGPDTQELVFAPSGAAWEATMGALLSQLTRAVQTRRDAPVAGAGLHAPYLAALKLPASSVHSLRQAHARSLNNSATSTVGLLVADSACCPAGNLAILGSHPQKPPPPPFSEAPFQPASSNSISRGDIDERPDNRSMPAGTPTPAPASPRPTTGDSEPGGSHCRAVIHAALGSPTGGYGQGSLDDRDSRHGGAPPPEGLHTGNDRAPSVPGWMSMTVGDCVSHGLIEPASLAPRSWDLAVSLVIQVLRIDGVHAAGTGKAGAHEGLAQLNRGKPRGGRVRKGGAVAGKDRAGARGSTGGAGSDSGASGSCGDSDSE
ncbi:MAG: hypothetical protein WDW36_002984 [Sanguina aurantia]